MKFIIKKDTISKVLHLFIQDSSSTTGAGLTGLTYNSAGLTAYYMRPGQTTPTAITLVNITTLGTYVSGGFKEINAANMPGWYEFHPPNACLATGAVSCGVHFKGATNMAPLPLEVQLEDNTVKDAYDILNHVDYGNAKLVRATTPANALDVDANGDVTAENMRGTDGANTTTPPTVGQIADQVWDEAIAGHVAAGSFGAKNQKVVPSETLDDYKADVSALATAAALATHDGKLDTAQADLDKLTGADGTILATAQPNYAPAKVADIPTAVQNRQEMDSNSTQLAAIVGDTNEIQGKLPTKAKLMGSADADGGFDTEAKADIKTEADVALTDYDPPTKTEMDVAHALLATATAINRVLGLSYENTYQHTRVYSGGKLTSAKLDLYNSKANAQTHDGATGIVAKYTLTFTYSGDDMDTMLVVQDS